MLFISRRLRPPVIASVALILTALPGSASVVASPAGQTPTLQPTRPILLTDPIPDPHKPGVQWFAPTGHTVRGAFLDYWNRFGGLAQLGYPITEEFVEPVGQDNKPFTVQYFERNRFEHHPENAGTPYEVLLGRLGLDFHPADTPATPLPSPARYFAQTGHNLSGPFLGYWDTHGGLFVHGFPTTEQFEEVNPIDNKKYTVQYFERSRFEYHPENTGSPYEVLLGLLGRQLSQKKGYPYGWYPPYGHAADFSWVAGRYLYPTRMCPNCACDAVHYVQGTPTFQDGTNVQPYGPAWNQLRETRQIRHLMPIVIFGHRAGPDEQPEPCFAPPYFVERVQANPTP